MLDTSIGTFNIGDAIIMECVRKELSFIMKGRFELSLPTHLAPFHGYQVWRNSLALREYSSCKYKFVGGTNLLIPNLLTHFPQWNINLFNYKPLQGVILVGVGAGAGQKNNFYTKYIYSRMLNKAYLHSVRDERSKIVMEKLGFRAINTGCPTMWMFTPEFCKQIPTGKSSEVVFTVTRSPHLDRERYQLLIDILRRNYAKVYFWPQCLGDKEYFDSLENTADIQILSPDLHTYDDFLTRHSCDYVGTRLHGGIYAMRHQRRAIVLAIDERARGINQDNHLNCIEWDNMDQLEGMINSEFSTQVCMNREAIELWKSQFK